MYTNSFFYLSIQDAIKDTAAIIPFLLLIFFVIEIVEHFYSEKILSFIKFSKSIRTFCPAFGAILAAIPQCGLSVIASTLYCKRLITKGTLIAVYIATSDEAIPVLISNPKGYKIVLPLIAIKLIAALIAGYLIDIFFKTNLQQKTYCENIKIEKGCHSHNISSKNKKETIKELIFHPVIHTISVSFFIFMVTFLVNLIFTYFNLNSLSFLGIQNRFIEPVFAAFIGIIPNCAVSVGLAIMYLKGVISFASCISGLCAGAGLGILVLIRKNEDKKDTMGIIFLLLAASILTGLIISGINSFM